MEKLTIWWPDCTQDLSSHNSENWPQRNGNKHTPEMKINCSYNNQEDATEATDDQLRMTVRDDRAVPAWSPPPLTLSIEALTPLLVRVGSRPLNTCLPPSPQVASIWNKANFPFHHTGLLFFGFWAASSHIPHTHTHSFSNSAKCKKGPIKWKFGGTNYFLLKKEHTNTQKQTLRNPWKQHGFWNQRIRFESWSC